MATRKTTARKTRTAANKRAARRKTTKTRTARKSSAKKSVPAKKKKAAKKARVRKTPAKKTAARRTAAKKKAAPPKKKAAAKKKAPAKKTAAKAAPKKAAPTKAAAKKTAAQKTAVKKTEAKAPAPKPAPKPKKINVGQAPRRKAPAASIPIPSQTLPKEAPQADAKASLNAEAATSAKSDFKVNDKIVYPAHGVGKIVALERQQVAGIPIELFVIDFDQEKMKLRVPTGKARTAGMRPLSDEKTVKDAIATLKGRARIKRTMWSRRAQEYDAKINSGDIKLVAEVVRDLYRAEDQPEQSYSERQLFEAALDRMAREVAAVRKVDLGKAIEELEGSLAKKAS